MCSKLFFLRWLLPKPEPPGLCGLKLLIFTIKLKNSLKQSPSAPQHIHVEITDRALNLYPSMPKTPSYHH